MKRTSKRLLTTLVATSLVLFLTAQSAMASIDHGGVSGQGLYGETDDRVVTNAGFIVIAFFPLLIFVLSMLQWRLDKRRDARKAALKARSGQRGLERRLVARLRLPQHRQLTEAPLRSGAAFSVSCALRLPRGRVVLDPGRSEMNYFVTGGTGLIGRRLLERLLVREGVGDVYVLVRPASVEKLAAQTERLAGAEKIRPIAGDLTQPNLGLSDDGIAKLRDAGVDHFFHLAAIYDMTAGEEGNRLANVEGTRNAVSLANALEAGTFHHVSSIAAAGSFKGLFREDMFDEGQKLDHPYHRSKFESERIARTQTAMPWRVYRPAIVVGDSRTGEMDKIDGPYYFFKAIQKLRSLLPQWFPLVGPELGYTNIVPVDFVADALDHIAHRARPRQPRLPPRRPAPAALGRGDERVRRRRARAAAGDADRPPPDAGAAEGHDLDADEAAGGEGRAQKPARPTTGSRTRSSTTSR